MKTKVIFARSPKCRLASARDRVRLLVGSDVVDVRKVAETLVFIERLEKYLEKMRHLAKLRKR